MSDMSSLRSSGPVNSWPVGRFSSGWKVGLSSIFSPRSVDRIGFASNVDNLCVFNILNKMLS